MPKSGIYKILNTKNGKCYIGSSNNLKYRIYRHTISLRNGNHYNAYLQRAWNKYSGWIFEFSVIEYCEVDKLIEREQFYIDTLKPEYNICPTAGNTTGYKHNEEAKANMFKAKLNTSYRRLKSKWPCPEGVYCQCEDCRQRRREIKLNWENNRNQALNTLSNAVMVNINV